MKRLFAIIKTSILLALMAAPSQKVFSQIIDIGLKAGGQWSWVRSDDAAFRKLVNIHPVPGYNAGAVIAFKVMKRFSLHTEYLYSTKGKRITGKIDKLLEDRITYRYLDVPVLYNIQFKGNIGRGQFKWYAGAGPLFSYWLGGNGTVNADEFEENNFQPIDYTIRFGERGEDLGETDAIYMTAVKRFQLGFNLGGGILLEPGGNRKIMVDARLELGHTWMGTPESADYVLPVTYDDNLKARNMGLRFSVMYLFETNLDKKVRNRGKSNLKVKGQRIRPKR